MKEDQRRLNGLLYNPYNCKEGTFMQMREVMDYFNNLPFSEIKEGIKRLKEIFGHLEDDAMINKPIFIDHGSNIYIGKHFYSNFNLTVLDEAKVTIGDNVYLAPNVSIFTAAHPIVSDIRNTDLEYALPVTIGNNVWIGGSTVINPGVTIGNNTVIGSGSVVTSDIPDNVIAFGNPCRVYRTIDEKDKEYWHKQYSDYINDKDIK